jgi:hypothetical protein
MKDLASKGLKLKKIINPDIKNQFSLVKIGKNYKNRLTVINDSIKKCALP